MRLFYSETSPFARKVRIVAHEVGVAEQIEEVLDSPFADDSVVASANPLGQIPALVRDDGSALYDSGVICAFLDSTYGTGALFPAGNFEVLRLHALADGVMEAAVANRLESLRPTDKQFAPMRERRLAAITRGLAALERDVGGEFNIGSLSAACALGYLDLRFGELDWRGGHSGLRDFYTEFSKRPSLAATAHPS